MRVGTKSVLFGVHQPIIHGAFMAWAWVKLYGLKWEFFDPRLHTCFLLHDIGYWGCESMDGPDGELHPIRGSRWTRTIFGDEWGDMCLFHSGTMVKKWNKASKENDKTNNEEDWWNSEEGSVVLNGNARVWFEANPSKLYAPDKLASALYPRWLYKLLSCLSGEWKEYAEIQFGGKIDPAYPEFRDAVHLIAGDMVAGRYVPKFIRFEDWHALAMKNMKKRAYEHAKSGEWMTHQEAVGRE